MPHPHLQQIVYKEPPSLMMLPVYLGNRQRYPSVTDLLLLAPYLYLVAHRYGAKLYITEVDPVTHQHRTLFQEKAVYHGITHYVESMEIYQNKVYVIAYSEYMLIYQYKPSTSSSRGPRLQLERVCQMGPSSIRYHGMKVYQDHIYLTPSMGEATEGPTEILKYNPITEMVEKLQSPDIHRNYRIKDMIFLGDDRILLIVNYKIQKRMTQRGAIFNGFFGLYEEKTLQILDRVEYEHVHFDRGVYDPHAKIFYVTGGDARGGYLWRGQIEDRDQDQDQDQDQDPSKNKIRMLEPMEVADFPHGIRVEKEEDRTKLMYTAYGTDSIYYGYLE